MTSVARFARCFLSIVANRGDTHQLYKEIKKSYGPEKSTYITSAFLKKDGTIKNQQQNPWIDYNNTIRNCSIANHSLRQVKLINICHNLQTNKLDLR